LSYTDSLRRNARCALYYKAALARGTRCASPVASPPALVRKSGLLRIWPRARCQSRIPHQRPCRRSITRKGDFALPLQTHRFFQKDQRERFESSLVKSHRLREPSSSPRPHDQKGRFAAPSGTLDQAPRRLDWRLGAQLDFRFCHERVLLTRPEGVRLPFEMSCI